MLPEPAYRGRTIKVMADMAERLPNGRFAAGHKKLSVRTVGTPNKITRDVKAGMLDSAIEHGSDGKGTDGLKGFCAYLLRTDLKAYASIFGRLIPLQVDGNLNVGGGTVTVQVMSMPVGSYLSAEQAAEIMKPPQPALIIDNTVIDNETSPEEIAPIDTAAPSAAVDD